MTTITEIREFREFVERQESGATLVPDPLREGAPVPTTWPYSPEAWEAFVEEAREHLRLKPAYDFAFDIAVQGYRPSELASGQLDPGSEVNLVTGQVHRPPEPTISVDTEARARRALRALSGRNLSIDTILQVKLEHVAWGRYTSDPKGAKAAIDVAESAVSRFDAERHQAVVRERQKPVLTVRHPFRAKGKSYLAGTYAVEPEVAAELQDWQAKMEAEQKLHDWDAPAGHCPENWPPFSVEDVS